MLDARRRPEGRFFYWLLTTFLVSVFLMWSGVSAPVARAATPATTAISDVVYRADGSPASGVVLISWPAFTAADGTPVAAGSVNVVLGNDGSLHVDLVPNVGASPSGAYYTAVFQLDDVVRTEYWLVGTTSPTTLAAVRATPGSGIPAQTVSKQYVDSAVATSKAYVDSAVASVGAGSFVAKGGDNMTGPLTLPSDPTGSNQASTKHYVDAGLSAKANLVSGVVPPVQLGSGTPDGTLCLKGDSSWGACGTSSNAVTIQNVAVDPTTPTDGQVITYDAASAKYKPKTGTGSGNATALQGVPVDTSTPSDGQVVTYDASSGKYKPKPGAGLSPAQQLSKYAGDFNWTSSPSTDMSTPGAKTVTLASCPAGVMGVDSVFYINSSAHFRVYVAGTGTPEAVQVTGGTCAGNGNPGTLQFTTVNGHAAGYTLSSTTGGIYEASIAARVNNAGANYGFGMYVSNGTVRVGPNYIKLYAPLDLTTSGQTIDFSGTVVSCQFDDNCINIYGNNVTLINPKGQPTILGGRHAFIADFANNGSRLFNVSTFMPLQVPGYPNGTYGTFGYGVVAVTDQALLLDGMTLDGGPWTITCNASFCGSAIYAPGPFSGHAGSWYGGPGSPTDNAALGWLKNLNLGLNCQANGIDWESGNTVRISDAVVQGYPQFGVRGGLAAGGYGMMEIDNLYEEVGACTNPAGNIGQAGVIVQGGKLKMSGGEGPAGGTAAAPSAPQGAGPQFAATGSTIYIYYVVPYNSTYGYGNPLPFGSAGTNGTGNITLTWPDVPGFTSVDILKVAFSGDPIVGPYGTGNYAVATGLLRSSTCAGGVCTYTDTQAALAFYTVPSTISYYPRLSYWPSPLVLSSAYDYNYPVASATASLDLNDLNSIHIWQANTVGLSPGTTAITESGRCQPANGSPVIVACVGSNAAMVPMATTMLGKIPTDGGQQQNLKGRLNFLTNGSGPVHIITLADSNYQKTTATAGNRPPNDANDAYIGCDSMYCFGYYTGLTFGAPASISNYIANNGDGTNWLERLTSGAKIFKVNVTAPVLNATTGFQIGGSSGTSGQCLKSSGTGSAWGACGSGSGSSPLIAKGDLWGFNTADARVPVGTDGSCLVADSTNAVGVKWGSCGSGAALDSAVVHNTGTETIGGDKTFSGNVTVQGAMMVSGAWQVESAGPITPMTVGTGDSKVGFDSDGKLKVSENGGAVTEVAKVSQIPAAMAGAGTCANKVVTATNVSAPPTCTTVTAAYVDSSIASTTTLVNGNYAKATGGAALADSGVAAGPYTMPWLTTPRGGSPSGVTFSATANQAKVWGVVLTFPVTTTQVRYYVGTADNTANVYDIGIYDAAGNLKAHLGPKAGTSFAPVSAASYVQTWSAAVTLQPGKYYLAITTNCTTGCATLDGDNASGVTFQNGGTVTATSGTLNGTITPPSDSWSWSAYTPAWVIY